MAWTVSSRGPKARLLRLTRGFPKGSTRKWALGVPTAAGRVAQHRASVKGFRGGAQAFQRREPIAPAGRPTCGWRIARSATGRPATGRTVRPGRRLILNLSRPPRASEFACRLRPGVRDPRRSPTPARWSTSPWPRETAATKVGPEVSLDNSTGHCGTLLRSRCGRLDRIPWHRAGVSDAGRRGDGKAASETLRNKDITMSRRSSDGMSRSARFSIALPACRTDQRRPVARSSSYVWPGE